jgi:hypothetical protein
MQYFVSWCVRLDIKTDGEPGWCSGEWVHIASTMNVDWPLDLLCFPCKALIYL